MTVTVVICVVLLVGACAYGVILRNVRNQYMTRIRGLRRDKLDVEMRVKDLKKDILLREARVATLTKEVEALEEKKRRELEEAANAAPPTRSIVDVLQANGVISAEDVLKARTYLQASKSESTEEQALVILGIVTVEQIKSAQAELE